MKNKITQVLKLTEKDVLKYRLEIDEIDVDERERVLAESVIKITRLFENKKIDQFQLVLLQEINGLHNILYKNPNLETLVQQKIIFALKYFLEGNDDIPDDLPGISLY